MSTIDERWNIVNTTRAFCQKVLPLVYDESLSYMELVCKLSSKLNEVIENNNNLPLYVKDLIKDTVNSDEFTQIVGSVMLDTIINVKYPPEGITPAKGDGVTDDTSSIQACFDYANNQGGAVVFFPSGKYLTGTLNINIETSILGADRYNTSLVLKGGGNTPLLQGAINQSVRNISLDGNRLNQVEENYLIAGTIDMALFDNVILCDSAHCITAGTCNNSEFCNILCKDIGDSVFITATGNNNLLTNINTEYAINLTGTNNNWQSPQQTKIGSAVPIIYQTPQKLNDFFNYITMTDDNDNVYKVLVDENVDKLATDEFINVKNAEVYGLNSVVGDGVTDDSANFQNILSYASNNEKAVLIPFGTNVLLKSNVTARNLYYLEFRGSITLENSVLQIGANSTNVKSTKYNIYNISGGKLQLVGLKNAIVTLQNCDNLELFADNSDSNIVSMAYSTFILGKINDFAIKTVGKGWINENTFIKGRFKNILITGDYRNNHNIFYNPVLESTSVTIESGSYNYFLNCRLEGENNITFGANAWDNKIVKSWYSSGMNGLRNMVPSTTGGSITDNGERNQVITDARENARITEIANINSSNATKYLESATVDGLNVNFAKYTMINFGLFPILNKTSLVEYGSDAANWRIIIKPYDANFQPFTSDPGICPGMTWKTDYYQSTASRKTNDARINTVNTDVAYCEIKILSDVEGPFKFLEYVKIDYKDKIVLGQS